MHGEELRPVNDERVLQSSRMEMPMNTWMTVPLVALAAGLFIASRYNWIPRGLPKAISNVLALLIVIVALAIFISPLRELGK